MKSKMKSNNPFEMVAFVTWTGPIGAGGELPPRSQCRRRCCACLRDLRHPSKVLDLDPGFCVLSDDDFGDGHVGLDLDPLVVGVGVGLVASGGCVRVRLALQDHVGRAETESP